MKNVVEKGKIKTCVLLHGTDSVLSTWERLLANDDCNSFTSVLYSMIVQYETKCIFWCACNFSTKREQNMALERFLLDTAVSGRIYLFIYAWILHIRFSLTSFWVFEILMILCCAYIRIMTYWLNTIWCMINVFHKVWPSGTASTILST